MKNDYTLYILMRNDLPSMSTGRAMAQASHAANAFVFENPKANGLRAWQKQTAQGFGTAIVLAANEPQIAKILSTIHQSHNFIINWVCDPEYGIKITNEVYKLMDLSKIDDDKTICNEDGTVIVFYTVVTCAYIFGKKEELKPILKELSLHP